MSPFVIGALSPSPLNAVEVPGNRDAPMVAAPAATIPFVRNARRFVGRFMLFSDFFIAFPLFQEIVFELFGPSISLSRLELTLTFHFLNVFFFYQDQSKNKSCNITLRA